MSEVEERRSFSSPRIPRRVTIAPVPPRDTTHPTQDYNPSPLSFSGSDDIETVNTNEIPIQKTQGNKRVNSRAVHFMELNPQDAWLPITESRNGKAYYAAFHKLCSGIGIQALMLPVGFTDLGW